MASKLPIVISNLPSIREVVTSGQEVVGVKPRDVQSLANGIKQDVIRFAVTRGFSQTCFSKSAELQLVIQYAAYGRFHKSAIYIRLIRTKLSD